METLVEVIAWLKDHSQPQNGHPATPHPREHPARSVPPLWCPGTFGRSGWRPARDVLP
jgi:hypothetical protein